MTVDLKINCKACMQDKHDECVFPERCLCAFDSHGVKKESLKDGVKVDMKKPIDETFYEDVEDVNSKIKHESKAFNNKNYDLVAEIIQSDNNFLTFRENKNMWYWSKEEKLYKPFGHTIIEESCQNMIHKCKRSAVLEVIDTIRRSRTMIDMKDLLDSSHINTQNGIIDPDTFELMPHSPEFLTTRKLPFAVNLKARNLKLWKHILTIIDPKDINLLMELMWIGISKNNPFKKMFVFKGLTNTQKSTLADIIVWIVGTDNISREKPTQYLSKHSRFSTSKFIGKSMNIASEIGNLDEDMLENQKSLVGAELQNTENKGDNTERYFDPTKFVFLYTTNHLGKIYSTINDNSVITRFQFLIFRNQLDDTKTNGQWYDNFFDNEDDRKSAIETVVNIIIQYNKTQSIGKIPKTQWSNIMDTKRILDEEMPIEDKYFADGRIIEKYGERLTLVGIKNDFESFVGRKIDNQVMGYIMKRHGFVSGRTNGETIYKGLAFAGAVEQGQTQLN